ncbi:MAG TPA: hypothetical protein VK612_06785 [Pyrinomonadaceae bacterium]|nr:hypothetical protein [Pyrinomonadaceae bacterium]
MKIISYIFFCLVVIIITVTDLLACKCADPPNAEESFETVDAVFYGVPERMEGSGDKIFALFKVEKSIKGVMRDRVWIETDATSCGMQFTVGTRAYLFVDGSEDTYRTLPCHRHSGDKVFEERAALQLESGALTSEHSGHNAEAEKPDIWTNLIFMGLGLVTGILIVLAICGVFYIVSQVRKR